MTALITRAEQARTREEAVAVFDAFWTETPPAPSLANLRQLETFRAHVQVARSCPYEDRALGYLLLAAMAVVPEGWWYDIAEGHGMDPSARLYSGEPPYYQDKESRCDDAQFVCTALLSAILKTEATNG